MYTTSFFWILVCLSCFSWISWYIVIHNVSPVLSPNIAFSLFYASLFFSITFTSSLICALLWKAIIPTKSSYLCFKNGVREGGLIGIMGTIAVFFQQYQYLDWRQIAVMLAIIILLETFFVLQSE